ALYDQAYLQALRRGDYVLASGCLLFRALAHLHTGDLAAAEEDLGRVSEHAELQMATPYHGAFAGWTALERGDLDAAERALAGSGARLEHAKALVELGAALRRGNRRSDARESLRQGLELAHRLGAGGLAERAQTELTATGARPRRLLLTGVDALTPSERRVA